MKVNIRFSALTSIALGLALATAACQGEVRVGSKPPEPPPAPTVAAPTPPPAPAPEPPPKVMVKKIALKGVTMKGNQIQMPGEIEFEFNKATIKETPQTMEILNKLHTIMKDNPSVTKIRIEGHTDNQGTKDYNQKLSEERAASVAKWLSDKGIDKARIHTVGLGMDRPVAANDTAENKAKNRRTEFHLEEMDGKPVDAPANNTAPASNATK